MFFLGILCIIVLLSRRLTVYVMPIITTRRRRAFTVKIYRCREVYIILYPTI